MYTVYVLQSTHKNYRYVGLTNNLARRTFQHQSGKEPTTRSYRPFILIHTEECTTRKEARVREKHLKSGFGKEWLKSTYR